MLLQFFYINISNRARRIYTLKFQIQYSFMLLTVSENNNMKEFNRCKYASCNERCQPQSTFNSVNPTVCESSVPSLLNGSSSDGFNYKPASSAWHILTCLLCLYYIKLLLLPPSIPPPPSAMKVSFHFSPATLLQTVGLKLNQNL